MKPEQNIVTEYSGRVSALKSRSNGEISNGTCLKKSNTIYGIPGIKMVWREKAEDSSDRNDLFPGRAHIAERGAT